MSNEDTQFYLKVSIPNNYKDVPPLEVIEHSILGGIFSSIPDCQDVFVPIRLNEKTALLDVVEKFIMDMSYSEADTEATIQVEHLKKLNHILHEKAEQMMLDNAALRTNALADKRLIESLNQQIQEQIQKIYEPYSCELH